MMNAISLLIIAVIGVVGYIVNFTSEHWLISVLSWLGFVIFVVAPTRIGLKYLRQTERMKPCLEILDITETNIGYTGAEWSLEIRNNGTEPARDCHGNLEDIEFESPPEGLSLKSWRKNHDLQWSGEVENASSFTIAGGQKAMLILVSRDSDSANNNVTLAYRGTEQFRLQYKLSQTDPILLLINITSEGKVPQYAICRLSMKDIASNMHRAYSKQLPVTLLYCGEQVRRLGEFQKGLKPLLTSDM